MSTPTTVIIEALVVLAFYKLRSYQIWGEYHRHRNGDDPLERIYAARIAAVQMVTTVLQAAGFAVIMLGVMVGVRLVQLDGMVIIPLVLVLGLTTMNWQIKRILEVTA